MAKKQKRSKSQQTVFVFAPTAQVIPLAVKGKGLVLTGHEKLASAIKDRAERIEILQKEDKKDKGAVAKLAKSLRMDAEINGNFQKSVLVVCEAGKPIRVEFGDSYSDLDVKHEEALKEALADRYAEFFGRFVTVKARETTTLEALKECLGDKFDAFLGLVQVDESLSPKPGFMESRAALRATLSHKANETIDNLVAQIQKAPSVKTK